MTHFVIIILRALPFLFHFHPLSFTFSVRGIVAYRYLLPVKYYALLHTARARNLTSCDARAFPILPWSSHPRCSSSRRVWRPIAYGWDFARSRLKVEIVILSLPIAISVQISSSEINIYFLRIPKQTSSRRRTSKDSLQEFGLVIRYPISFHYLISRRKFHFIVK